MSAPDRVDLIRLSNALTGLDFVQVSASQLELRVFVHHLVLSAPLAAALAAITPDKVSITAIGQVTPATVAVTQHVLPLVAVDGRIAMRFTVATPGGFGFYKLHIDDPAVDTYFNNLHFSFKADCPSELDCLEKPHECPSEDRVDHTVDYRARDFWSFREALLDFASARYPDWQDRLEADSGMVIVELRSALGDEFAYGDDRIAREHRLDDASQRRSLRRLAALVDYPLDNGSGAFAWIDVEASAAGVVPAGAAITDSRLQVTFELGRGLADTGKTFAVSNTRNTLLPYLWDEDDVCLDVGARHLTLSGHHSVSLNPDPLIDGAGKWVLLETVPTDPARPERRLAVRVVKKTDTADPLNGNPITEIEWDRGIPFELDLEALRVRANLVPATSAATQTATFRVGPPPPGVVMERTLERVGPNHDLTDEPDEVFDQDEVDTPPPRRRVKHLFSLDGSEVTPVVWLPAADGRMVPEVELQKILPLPVTPWDWMDALIGTEVASVTDPAFTLEDGTYRRVFGVERVGGPFEFADYASSLGSTIRFGDDEFGQAPADGDVFQVRFRLGNGRLMNVAPDTLTRLPGGPPPVVVSVRNPLAAEGGRDPESDAQIRVNAPQDFRQRPLRAVRPEDYAEIAERLPWVQKAGATFRWTGSWATMFVTPDPRDEFGLSRAHRRELEDHLDRVRQAGRDVRVLDPRYADIDLEIEVCVEASAYIGDVKERVLVALFGDRHTTGFFDPDNFTFGMPLSRAALMAVIQEVAGVRAVERMRVRRRGYFAWRPFNEFALRVGVNELVRVTNDHLLPERGAVRLVMEGGA